MEQKWETKPNIQKPSKRMYRKTKITQNCNLNQTLPWQMFKNIQSSSFVQGAYPEFHLRAWSAILVWKKHVF